MHRSTSTMMHGHLVESSSRPLMTKRARRNAFSKCMHTHSCTCMCARTHTCALLSVAGTPPARARACARCRRLLAKPTFPACP